MNALQFAAMLMQFALHMAAVVEHGFRVVPLHGGWLIDRWNDWTVS